MTRRTRAGGIVLLLGVVIALLGGPDHGVNGCTVVGFVLGVIGLALMAKDI